MSGRKEDLEANKENAGASQAGRGSLSPVKGWVEGGDEEVEVIEDEVEKEVEEVEGGEDVEEDIEEEQGLGDLMDSDVDGEDGEDGIIAGARRAKWLQGDRTKLYEHVLGVDADDTFALLQKNRKHVFKKVSTY